METLKQIGVGLCVVVVVCAGMLWVTMGPEIKAEANRAAEARGWREPWPVKEQVLHSFGPMELRADMPKTQVPGNALSGSCTFKHAVWTGMDGLNLYQFGQFDINLCGQPLQIGGAVDPSGHPGQYGFIVGTGAAWEEPPLPVFVWTDIPEDGAVWVEIDIAVSVAGSTSIASTVTTTPIGDKAATHAKEVAFADEWVPPDAKEVTYTINGATAVVKQPGGDASIYIHGTVIDADEDWTMEIPPGTKYVMSIENIVICGTPINTSSFEPTNWGTSSGSEGKLWVEGFGGNSIGFWISETFIPPPYDYSDYPGGIINAPFSYNFANMEFKWLDGSDLPDSLEVYCTGLRRLNESGVDIGPRKLTIAELRSKTWTQQHGCYYWDTWNPDMQAQVEIYLSLASAEALGIEVRGPRPEFKVEGAGYGQTDTADGPYDGQYAPVGTHNGETMYSNGYGYLYCTDASGPDWGLGPGPPTDPYYEQTMGGPGGSYLVNTTSYNDDIIDAVTGRRQFSGLLGYGLGPAVTADTGETISVDSDLAIPAFSHDGTVIFDCWPLSATNRTDAPYMTNVCSIGVEGDKDIYASAHTHEDWVGTNCTTPTAGGEFTVDASGGTLNLALACNYPARQASSSVGAIQVPTRYRVRRHDALLGTGNPEEEEEAVWDWRGRYLLQSFKDLSLPCDLTCRIVYYDDLGGCSDNHKTDSTRQTEYGYDPGPAYTLERTITVTYANVDDWSPVLIDLYDEQNGHPVARVESIEWEFPAAGTLTMTEPQLVLDPGDRQEIVTGTPGYREAPTNNGAKVKIDESWRYAQGVVSAHVNGLCDRVLFMPDHVKPCTVERCFDTLNVVIGAKTGQDMTTCYSLGSWPVNDAGEAWSYSYSGAAEQGHMKDADDDILKTLTVADIRPEMVLEASGEVIIPSVAVRCYSVTCVRGLTYMFHGRKIVGGRGHGMMVKKDLPDDFPRARGGKGGGLYRRHLGSSDPWQSVEATLTSDEHGHWSSAAWEIADTDAARTLWEYAAGGVLMGRWATREFALAQIFELLRKQPDLAEDKFGRPVVVYVHDGDVWCSRIETLAGVPEVPVMVVDADDAIHPAVELMDDGLLVVTWTDGGAAYMRHSTDGGQTWVDVV